MLARTPMNPWVIPFLLLRIASNLSENVVMARRTKLKCVEREVINLGHISISNWDKIEAVLIPKSPLQI